MLHYELCTKYVHILCTEIKSNSFISVFLYIIVDTCNGKICVKNAECPRNKCKCKRRYYQILDEAGEMIECRSELLLCVLNGDFIQPVTGGMSTSFQQSKFHEISWKFLL